MRGPPKATLGWRFLCQPDGRVEVSRDDDTDAKPVNDRVTAVTTGPRTGDTATILLGQLRAPGTIQNAELKVTLDGRVSSRLVAETAARTNSMVSDVGSGSLTIPETERVGPSENREVWKKTAMCGARTPCRRSFSPALAA